MQTRYDILLLRVRQLERGIAARASGREREWAEEVGTALDKILAALRKHSREMDAPDGTFAEVDLTRPTLARQAGELRDDQEMYLEHAQALRDELRDAVEPEALPDLDFLRTRLADFVAALKKHCGEEARLVYESVTTDIGVGD